MQVIRESKDVKPESVWWPGVMRSIAQLVQNCHECAEQTKNKKEPLITTPLSDYPWQLVGTGLFELDKCQYLLVVNYFSRYPEVVKLSSTTSSQVTASQKTIFARHGILETVCSDNGQGRRKHSACGPASF